MSLLYIKQNISHGLTIANINDFKQLSSSKQNDVYNELFEKTKEIFKNRLQVDSPYLFEQTKASHFGYVNKNKTMYPVSKADASAKSWYTPFEKPVLKNHDPMVDPLGRHVHAAYIPFDISNDLKDSIYVPKGVIVTHAVVTDPDAMQKVRDGRYLTVSIGATSGKLKCSICGQNWLDVDPFDEDRCDHEPGMWYDIKGKKKLCYKETDTLSYHERSYVNTPADQSESHFAGVSNYELICQTEDDFKDADYIAKNMLGSKESTVIADSTGYVLSLEPDGEGNYPTKSPTYYFSQMSDESDELDWDELERLLSEELGDAKLKTSARKALPDSAFCGPNRSFPVPDCAHVRAALRLLGRYNGPGKKSSIRACVERKARKLGCPVNSDSETDHDDKESLTENVVLVPKLTTSDIDEMLANTVLPHTMADKHDSTIRGKNENSTRKETHQMPAIIWEQIPVNDALENIPGLSDYIDRTVREKADKVATDALASRDKALQDAAAAKATLETLQTDYEKIMNQAKVIAIDTVMALMAQLEKPQYMKIVTTHSDNAEGFETAIKEMKDKIAARELNSLVDTISDLKSELDAKILLDSQSDEDDDEDDEDDDESEEDQTAMDGITDSAQTSGHTEDDRLSDSEPSEPKTKSLI